MPKNVVDLNAEKKPPPGSSGPGGWSFFRRFPNLAVSGGLLTGLILLLILFGLHRDETAERPQLQLEPVSGEGKLTAQHVMFACGPDEPPDFLILSFDGEGMPESLEEQYTYLILKDGFYQNFKYINESRRRGTYGVTFECSGHFKAGQQGGGSCSSTEERELYFFADNCAAIDIPEEEF